MIREASPFSVSADDLENAFANAAAFVAREYNSPSLRPIVPTISQSVFDGIIATALPENGMPLNALADHAQDFLAHCTARLLPAGFSAMVTTSPNPYALLADILACAVNQHLARGDVCEFAARLEERAIQWIAQFTGYPAASGTLTPGGASANLVALMAARTAVLGKAGRNNGLNGTSLVAYASTESHISVERAIDVLGIGTDNLRRLPVGSDFRVNTDALRSAIASDRAAGHIPFAVIAQGGSVTTGAVDPLSDIAQICSRENIWLHVDGAYGGAAAAVAPEIFAGLALADSVTIDPHKWLYVNYDCGCVLTRRPLVLEQAFGAETASYLRADSQTDAPDFMNRGIDFSRGFRALKVWATFAGLGANKLRLAISQDIALAAKFGEMLAADRRFEIVSQPSLSIVTFRFVPEDKPDRDYVNALNSRMPSALRKDGRIYLGSAQVAGATALRVCLINHRVTDRDLGAWLEIIAEMGNALHRERLDWWGASRSAQEIS
jgi:aromatic-L-amino-acid decarboxylase